MENRHFLVMGNIYIKGRRTTVRLEPKMWAALNEICKKEFLTPEQVSDMVYSGKPRKQSMTSAFRIFALDYFKNGGIK